MNDNAQSILVSAIACHGGKLAINDAYCKVYLAGYMVDYPAEKQLLIALRQQDLPKTIIAYLQMEITELNLYAFIKTLEGALSNTKRDLTWGIDTWAAALLVPERVRRNIREQCLLLTSEKLNSDQEPVFYDREFGGNERHISEVKPHKYPGSALFPLGVMALFGFIAFPIAVGHIPTKEIHSSVASPVKYLSKQNHQPTVLPKPAKVVVALIDEPTVKPHLSRQNTPKKAQRNRRLNSYIEAFLKRKN